MNARFTLSGAGALQVAGALDVYAADAFREAALNHLSERGSLELDLGSLERCDLIGLQLLVSARKSALAGSRRFRLLNPPPCLAETAAGAGLAPEAYSDSPLP